MANIGKLIKGGYTVAKKAISGIKKKSDLEKLVDQIKKQSVKAQAPGKTLRNPGAKKPSNASRFVERRKQLRGAGKSKGNTAGTLTTYGVGVGAGSGATMLGMKKSKKKDKPSLRKQSKKALGKLSKKLEGRLK